MSRNEGDQRGGPGPKGPGPLGPGSGPMPIPHRGGSPTSSNQEPDQRGGPGGPAGPGPMQKPSSSMLPHRGDHQRGDSPMSRLDDIRSGGPPESPMGSGGPRGPGGPMQPSKMMNNSRDPRGDSPLSRGVDVLGGRSGPPGGPAGPGPSKMMHNSRDPRGDSPLSRGLDVLGGRSGPPGGLGGPPGGPPGGPGGLPRRGVSPMSRDERGTGRGSPNMYREDQPPKRGQSPMMSFGERGRSGSPALTPTGSSLLSRPPSTTLPSVASKKDFVKEWNKGKK